MSFDELISNFFGMSCDKQIEFIRKIKTNNNISSGLRLEFDEIFSNYYSDITYLLEQLNKYNSLSYTQKRYLSLKTLNYFSDTISYDNYENFLETEKMRFIHNYTSDYAFTGDKLKSEFSSYFKPKKINDEKTIKYLDVFDNMNTLEKNRIVERLCCAYSNLSFFGIPYPDTVFDSYKEVLINTFGIELYKYYEILSYQEKLSLIFNISSCIDKYELCDNDEVFIDRYIDLKNQKTKVIDMCKKYLLNEAK